jgi:hypothetical protein
VLSDVLERPIYKKRRQGCPESLTDSINLQLLPSTIQ